MRGGQTPVWDEEARFKLKEGPQNRLLKLSVLDETDTKPELIGDTVIQLQPAFDSNPVEGYDEWHELTYKGKYAGEVYLEMTFYPAKPPSAASRKKRASQKYSESASAMDLLVGSGGASQQSHSHSQLGYSQSMMSASVSTTRPLPDHPDGTPALAASVAVAGVAAGASTIAGGRQAGGTVHDAPSSSLNAQPNYGVSSASAYLPPTPPAHSVYGRDSTNGGLMNMSTMSRSLPNPFDYQEFGDLQTIPPEHQHYQHQYMSPEEEEDPMAFFTTPLPPSPGEEEYIDRESATSSSTSSTPSSSSAASVSRHSSSQSAHLYSPTKSSPLSQSTSYESLEFSDVLGPNKSQNTGYDDYSNIKMLDQHLPPLPPAHSGRVAASSGGTRAPRDRGEPTTSNSQQQQQQRQRTSVRRKPISHPHDSASALSSSASPSSFGSMSSGFARSSFSNSNQHGSAGADDYEYLGGGSDSGGIPFSADSYHMSVLPVAMGGGGHNGIEDRSAGVGPRKSGHHQHREQSRKHRSKNSRRKSEQPRSTDSQQQYMYHHESGPHVDEFAESVSSKPLPRAPSMVVPVLGYGHSHGHSISSKGPEEEYLGEGQWDLSDELNAGYSDDVYGFMGVSSSSSSSSSSLPGSNMEPSDQYVNHYNNMGMGLPQPPQRNRSRHDRMSLPVDLSHKRQQSNRVYSGATIRGSDECMGDYYYSDEDEGIRYVQ